jgi:RNA-binding protein
MQLTISQRKYLRGLAHDKKPVVMVGAAGLTAGVLNELAQTLDRHELIKVKISVGDRDARDAIIDEMCQEVNATLVQRVGNIATVFKQLPKDSKFTLPRP